MLMDIAPITVGDSRSMSSSSRLALCGGRTDDEGRDDDHMSAATAPEDRTERGHPETARREAPGPVCPSGGDRQEDGVGPGTERILGHLVPPHPVQMGRGAFRFERGSEPFRRVPIGPDQREHLTCPWRPVGKIPDDGVVVPFLRVHPFPEELIALAGPFRPQALHLAGCGGVHQRLPHAGPGLDVAHRLLVADVP